jgi:septum formation protein
VDRRQAFPPDFELILASQSPRRHSLLRDVDVPFRVAVSAAEEGTGGDDVRLLAERNAVAKVRGAVLPVDVSAGAFVLGTDTLVCADERVMGKPSSDKEAADMLRVLSGRTHQVVSGVCLVRGTEVWPPATVGQGGRTQPGLAGSALTAGAALTASAVTHVTFMPLVDADIEAYVVSGEWKGKAGAYAIQGLAGLFVAGLQGEYSNVVGLPLGLLGRMFRDLGFDLLQRRWLQER